MRNSKRIDNEELRVLVPSDDVRRFILDSGYAFTDWQKAALLYRRDFPQTAERAALYALRDAADDATLKRQLTEYLTREEKALQMLAENAERDFIYILTYKNECDEEETQYFFDYAMALRYGTQTGFDFVIEKHLVGAEKVLCRFDDGIYRDYAIATICFDKTGKVENFDSNELHPADWESGDEWHSRFENMFYEVPNPFERGDIVRIVETEDYGVVETSQAEWLEWLERYRSPDWEVTPDWSDVQIRVIFPNEDGEFCHDHINPVYLERYQPGSIVYGQANPIDLEQYQPETDSERRSALDDLLLCARALYRGRESFENLYYFQERYRKAKETESEAIE